MRKKGSIVAGMLGLLFVGGIVVGANGIKIEKFSGMGEKVYYIPVVKTADSDAKRYKIADYEIPDVGSVKVGDVFKSDKGYERVIGISEDGSSYLSETLFEDEIRLMKEKGR